MLQQHFHHLGHTADLALGLALARPERIVICLNGDGSMLMSLGTLATIAATGAANLRLFILDNGVYEITGNQPVTGAGRIDYPALGRAAGLERAVAFDDAAAYETALPAVLADAGPTLVALRVAPGGEGPIQRSPGEAAAYLQTSLAESARQLRNTLIVSG